MIIRVKIACDRVGPRMGAVIGLVALLFGATARAQTGDDDPSAVQENATSPELAEASTGYLDPPAAAFQIAGYVDVGFVDADGDGSSFPADDTRVPLDYVVDPFAPAINSRGEVASTDAGRRFTNHFLPRSAAVGGRPSFLINTASVDLRFATASDRVLVFLRTQALPRFDAAQGNRTALLVEQAFGRLIPFETHELAITVGKSDSVFGIEYLENQANLRVGITPSLFARYTTGPSTGVKIFYRLQLPGLFSALSLNTSATNGGPLHESLMTPELSLTGRPVATARFGWDLNLPGMQVKLGGSGALGPRNDQRDPDAQVRLWGVDARLNLGGLALAGEWVDVREDAGKAGEKLTGTGAGAFASGFWARGGWVRLGYRLGFSRELVQGLTPYVRLERRRARFDGFGVVESRRLTAGLQVDAFDLLAVKGEWLFNREAAGAPRVDNDVKLLSAVFSF